MDRIEQQDWGVYYFFRYIAEKHPQIPQLLHVHWADAAGGNFVVAGIVAIGLALLIVQRRRRDAILSTLTFAAACGAIELVKWIVPRKRPEDAKNLLADADMLGSYPSRSVFLLTLAMVILGFALWKVLPAIWQRTLFVALAALLVVWVCMAQFFLALHFLTDILGGLAGAALFGYVASRFLEEDRRH
ncbi:MAG: phosphatase PAP2 family protein [Gemmataceae bacterium]|nr:phosphatase PAP2 family protein [Gemmataceae bacterium]